MKIIDAEKTILGRLASFAAKEALKGEAIIIVNAEKAVITGNREHVFESYLERKQRKSIVNPRRHGPKYPRRPDLLLKRAIRGMLPWKKAKGREAFKRIKAYIGMPQEFKNQEKIKIENATVEKLEIPKYVTLKEISEYLGYKFD